MFEISIGLKKTQIFALEKFWKGRDLHFMFVIKKIHLLNYRKYSDCEFKLNPEMNVFVGKSGSGKTSVLEAVCVSLGAFLNSFQEYVSSRYVFNISHSDVHRKQLKEDENKIVTGKGIPQYPCKITCSAIWGNDEIPIKFQRALEKANGRTRFVGENPMRSLITSWESEIKKAEHTDSDLIFPIVLYLNPVHLWNENNSLPRFEGVYGRTDAYNKCLDKKHGIGLSLSYIRMLQMVAVEENDGKHFPAYDAILNSVNTVLQGELAPGEKVIFSPRYGRSFVAMKTTSGEIIPLGDEYRVVIEMILDIAIRMCMLNPYLKGEALLKTPGIVVIDEIDSYLHPTWQCRIISILKQLFPRVQFICATNSPFIINSLKAKNHTWHEEISLHKIC